jgi:hypothetical protein
MAEKKNATTKKTPVEDVAAANASTTNLNDLKELELTEEEQTVFDVMQTKAEGGTFSGKFKLKDPETQYAEADFTLTGDQEKELPENPSPELLARIRNGFIKKA